MRAHGRAAQIYFWADESKFIVLGEQTDARVHEPRTTGRLLQVLAMEKIPDAALLSLDQDLDWDLDEERFLIPRDGASYGNAWHANEWCTMVKPPSLSS